MLVPPDPHYCSTLLFGRGGRQVFAFKGDKTQVSVPAARERTTRKDSHVISLERDPLFFKAFLSVEKLHT